MLSAYVNILEHWSVVTNHNTSTVLQ